MICPHCKKSIAKKNCHTPVLAAQQKLADKAMIQLEKGGLSEWLERRKCSQVRLAQLLSEAAGEEVRKQTVNSWIKRGNIPPASKAAIWGLVFAGRV